jgi:CobQ-like glutamine amidotransferase family enzyme
VGNITIDAPPFGPVTGFENHSGRTYLEGAAVPFGRVLRGKGNNGRDHTEGIRCKNCIGTYLHGPILPKNPAVADFLILTALRRRDPAAVLAPLDDAVEEAAAKSAAARPV